MLRHARHKGHMLNGFKQNKHVEREGKSLLGTWLLPPCDFLAISDTSVPRMADRSLRGEGPLNRTQVDERVIFIPRERERRPEGTAGEGRVETTRWGCRHGFVGMGYTLGGGTATYDSFGPRATRSQADRRSSQQ